MGVIGWCAHGEVEVAGEGLRVSGRTVGAGGDGDFVELGVGVGDACADDATGDVAVEVKISGRVGGEVWLGVGARDEGVAEGGEMWSRRSR